MLSFILSTELMLGLCFSAQWVWFFIWSLPESQTVPSLCIHVIAALIHFSFLKHTIILLSHYFPVPNVLPEFSSRGFWVLPWHLLECLLPVHTSALSLAGVSAPWAQALWFFHTQIPGTEHVQSTARVEYVLKGWSSDSALVSMSLSCICMFSLLGEGKTQNIMWYSTASVSLSLCPWRETSYF